jgi:seryl-tRNA synthetase
MAITKIPITLTIDRNVSDYYKMIRRDINISQKVNDFLKLSMSIEKDDRAIEEIREELNEISSNINKQEEHRNILFAKLQEHEQKIAEQNKIDAQEQKKFEEDSAVLGQFLKNNNRELLG